MIRWLFDLGFGVALPLVCLWLDPMVFKHSGMGAPLLGFLRPEAYLAMAACMGALIVWKILGRDPTGILTGLILLGGALSGLVAVVMLPVALVGLLVGVGVMGIIPWLCAWVFFRNARAALQIGYLERTPAHFCARRIALSGIVTLILIGWGGHQARNARRYISDHAGSPDSQERIAAILSLQKWRWLIGEDFLVDDYINSVVGDPANIWRVQVYESVTRRDFETSLSEVFKE